MATQNESLSRDPLWYKDAIIYELHVKSFFDANDDGIGDFPGLIQKLDYLQDLGVTCLWLLPFYPSPLKDDGYDIADYFGIHPAYGTPQDFRYFVREAHRRGLRVIAELVINHTSDQHPWFQAARQAPAGSRKRDFYVWSDTDQRYSDARIIFTDSEASNWTWDPVAKAYYWHRFFHHQPDLNFDNPTLRKAILRVMRHWLDLGVDGLRLDAIPYLVEREGSNCENLPETHDVLKEFRRHLDEHYQDRMFLAEANQWPADVLPYFGEGDECHVAFHFPLMPRIFMALRQEDRHPILEIMRQTPEIPPECQWALFLRNHDELTLEMVTDEERDYMYREYAADVQARLNLGIRRRLAPLLQNSRRRIELLVSLLFSLPGTPILYYGDEIGMGDNTFLGDRNGVRTPMQWTGDRNGGFSRADFAKLILPPIMDPVYGYSAINVEAQRRDPSSLLNWTKRLIALRKQLKAFGRGTLEMLHATNRKVLAYARSYEDTTILVVANLSRFVQPVELDLARYKGLTPVELLGRVPFPAIGENPYFLSLGPHAFYWFRLEVAPEAIATQAAAPVVEQPESLPELKLRGALTSVMEGRMRATMERSVLPPFLKRQRWFGAKARPLETVSIRDWTLIDDQTTPTYLVLAEVYYRGGDAELYFVPMRLVVGPEAESLLQNNPTSVLARVHTQEGEGVLYDALVDEGTCSRLLTAIEDSKSWKSQTAKVRAARTSLFTEVAGDISAASLTARLVAAEQSNSSIRYGNRFVLKIFRRLESGPNPDDEVGRYLSETVGFNRVPKAAGSIEYCPTRREPTTLAVLQQWIPNQGTGWERTLQDLGGYYELAAGQPEQFIESFAIPTGTLLEVAASAPPDLVQDALGISRSAAAKLGQRTAEMHLALATETKDPAFSPEPLSASDLKQLAQRIRQQTKKSLASLAENSDRLAGDLRPSADRLLSLREQVFEQLETDKLSDVSITKIRCHGDYHLGQVLWVENDFVILDFEGEPTRTLAERRAKESPLKDVAGMLRSLDYAAHAALLLATRLGPETPARLAPWGRLWTRWTSAAFISAYRTAAAGASFIPPGDEQFLALLDLYMLEKALYELHYELNHRPDWVRIPLLGVLRLIAA